MRDPSPKEKFLGKYGSYRHVSEIINDPNSPPRIFDHIVKNPSLSLENSHKILDLHPVHENDWNSSANVYQVASMLAYTPHKEIIDKLAVHPNFHVAKNVVYNKGTSTDQLINFHSKHREDMHPNVPRHILEDIVSEHTTAESHNKAKARLDAGDYK